MNNKIKWIGAIFLLVNGTWVWAASLPADLGGRPTTPTPCSPSPKALPGGTLNLFVDSFPLTFRTVGPTPTARSALHPGQPAEAHQLSPQYGQPHPLARECLGHSAGQPDRLLQAGSRAKWSDGKPVTADDYTFGYEMMRSKDIKGPWFNNYYTTEVVAVEKIDDHTILVKAGSRKAKLDLSTPRSCGPSPSTTTRWARTG